MPDDPITDGLDKDVVRRILDYRMHKLEILLTGKECDCRWCETIDNTKIPLVSTFKGE